MNLRRNYFYFLFFSFIFFLPFFVFAASNKPFDYQPLENLPFGGTTPSDFYDYVEAIYKVLIGGAGICALLMIVIGGFMYTTSAGNNASMEKAKGVITDAIIGLLLVLTAYLVLFIINPDLVIVQKMKNISSVSEAGLIPFNPSAPLGKKGNCGGLSTQPFINLQCGDASQATTQFLNCMSKINPNYVITSISDGNGGLDCWSKYGTQCVTNNQKNCCFHSRGGSHYGASGSNAVDISTRNGLSFMSNEDKQRLMDDGRTCNATFVNDESSSGNHIHFQTAR